MQLVSRGVPANDPKPGNARADTDPSGVFAALDKVVAETPLATRLRIEGAPAEAPAAAAAPSTPPSTPGPQPAPQTPKAVDSKGDEKVEPVAVAPPPTLPPLVNAPAATPGPSLTPSDESISELFDSEEPQPVRSAPVHSAPVHPAVASGSVHSAPVSGASIPAAPAQAAPVHTPTPPISKPLPTPKPIVAETAVPAPPRQVHVELPVERPKAVAPEAGGRQNLVRAALIVLSVIAAVQAFFLIRGVNNRGPAPAAVVSTGTVSVQSTPPGAAIVLHGQSRGATPATLTLNPGDYSIEVTSGGVARTLPVTVRAGTSSNQHIVFGDAQARGGLEITSQPSGTRVSIDGTARGVTPLTVSDVLPGTYTIVLDGPSGSSRQTVTVQPGTTSSLAVTMPAPGVSGGWVSVLGQIEVELYENGSLLGSSQSKRIMLPAGRHVIEAVNAGLGYQSTHTVQVSPGGLANLRLDVPPANLDINAVPWADVTVAGKPLGATPLGNVSVPIGTHEIIFRHPQLGERRVNTTVTVKGPNRVSVNMNQR